MNVTQMYMGRKVRQTCTILKREVRGQGMYASCTSIVYERVGTEMHSGVGGGVIVCLVYVHCDCRKGADSSCYIRAGMYARYLNKCMFVKKIRAGVNGNFQ